MSLSSDQEIVPGRRWSKRAKIVAALIGLPALVYAPGFVMALPQGVATSLPFWAEAYDYTCSSTRARSLMVRVAPYSAASKGAAQQQGMGGWNCTRIKSFAEADLVGADPRAADSGQRYIRLYTPSHSERAQLPELATPDDMSTRFVSLRKTRAAEAQTRTQVR
jgi:hypothetical protein